MMNDYLTADEAVLIAYDLENMGSMEILKDAATYLYSTKQNEDFELTPHVAWVLEKLPKDFEVDDFGRMNRTLNCLHDEIISLTANHSGNKPASVIHMAEHDPAMAKINKKDLAKWFNNHDMPEQAAKFEEKKKKNGRNEDKAIEFTRQLLKLIDPDLLKLSPTKLHTKLDRLLPGGEKLAINRNTLQKYLDQ